MIQSRRISDDSDPHDFKPVLDFLYMAKCHFARDCQSSVVLNIFQDGINGIDIVDHGSTKHSFIQLFICIIVL